MVYLLECIIEPEAQCRRCLKLQPPPDMLEAKLRETACVCGQVKMICMVIRIEALAPWLLLLVQLVARPNESELSIS